MPRTSGHVCLCPRHITCEKAVRRFNMDSRSVLEVLYLQVFYQQFQVINQKICSLLQSACHCRSTSKLECFLVACLFSDYKTNQNFRFCLAPLCDWLKRLTKGTTKELKSPRGKSYCHRNSKNLYEKGLQTFSLYCNRPFNSPELVSLPCSIATKFLTKNQMRSKYRSLKLI